MKLLTIIATCAMALAICAKVGTSLYTWLQVGDSVRCVANEFTFGCSTTVGWIFSAVGVVVVAVAVYLWERFRGK